MTNREWLKAYHHTLLTEYLARDYSKYGADWKAVEEADMAFLLKVSDAYKNNGRIWK